MFVYTTKHIHKGTVIIVCEQCLFGMGHTVNPLDVEPYNEPVAVCGTCGKEERRSIQ